MFHALRSTAAIKQQERTYNTDVLLSLLNIYNMPNRQIGKLNGNITYFIRFVDDVYFVY